MNLAGELRKITADAMTRLEAEASADIDREFNRIVALAKEAAAAGRDFVRVQLRMQADYQELAVIRGLKAEGLKVRPNSLDCEYEISWPTRTPTPSDGGPA